MFSKISKRAFAEFPEGGVIREGFFKEFDSRPLLAYFALIKYPLNKHGLVQVDKVAFTYNKSFGIKIFGWQTGKLKQSYTQL